MSAPGLVEGTEHISVDDVIAHKADVAKQLMVVDLTVRQALLLIMTSAQERLLTLGTHKVLNMPGFPQGVHHPLLNRPATRATDGDASLVMATQAVQLSILLTGVFLQLTTTRVAVEVVGMVGLAFPLEVTSLNDGVALEAKVFA